MAELKPSEFEKLCSAVKSVEGVRFCAVRDHAGNTLHGGQKEGIPRIETDEERALSALRIGLTSGMLKSMPESFGKPTFVLIEFEKLTMLVIPIDEDLILHVTLQPGADAAKVKDQVQRWLESP